jgi:hypothetical protein
LLGRTQDDLNAWLSGADTKSAVSLKLVMVVLLLEELVFVNPCISPIAIWWLRAISAFSAALRCMSWKDLWLVAGLAMMCPLEVVVRLIGLKQN